MTHVPTQLALKLADVGRIKTFIETGTHLGVTTKWAAEHFDQVVTIEADHSQFMRTRSALAPSLPSVAFFYGYSDRHLVDLRAPIDGPCMFWLDAHHPTNDDHECPVLAELTAVKSNDVVLIDDAQNFLNIPPKPWNYDRWPSYSAIVGALAGRPTVVLGSVIVSVPVELWRVVFDYCRNRSPHERL